MTLGMVDAVEKLSTAVKKRTLIPFCGAGVSVGADPKLPLAEDYLEEHGMAGRSWIEATASLARMPDFDAEFNRRFGSWEREPSEQHRLLACLDAPYYITTNYDGLLEKAIGSYHRSQDGQVGVINSNDVSKVFSYRNLVIKLHGDTDSRELLVYTEKHYFDRIHQPNDVDGFVKVLLSTHTVLFVGYSIEDINVLCMLGSVLESATEHTPRKYALLRSVDKWKEQRLREYDVTPIDLQAKEDDFDDKVCDFLYRLWEQNEHYGTYTKIIEKAPATVEDKLGHAMTLRQNNQLEQADTYLRELYRQGVEMVPASQLPAFLWLVVSVEDKRENWTVLRSTDERLINPLLRSIERVSSARMAESLKAVYYSALAVALCRSGDYERADEYLSLVGKWRCTDTAPQGYQIVSANLLTARALVLLHCSTLSELGDPRELLGTARETLEEAGECFDRHGFPDSSEESHHLGRFYGTRAFVRMASIEADPEQGLDRRKLLDDAERSHNSKGSRTRFGRVAGLYCEAACRYWLARRLADSHECQDLVERAKELIVKAREGVDDRQRAVLLKLRMLDERLSELNGSGKNRPVHFDESDLSCLPELLRERVAKDPEEWLLLPLN